MEVQDMTKKTVAEVAALGVVVAMAVWLFPDFVRYLKIRSM